MRPGQGDGPLHLLLAGQALHLAHVLLEPGVHPLGDPLGLGDLACVEPQLLLDRGMAIRWNPPIAGPGPRSPFLGLDARSSHGASRPIASRPAEKIRMSFP